MTTQQTAPKHESQKCLSLVFMGLALAAGCQPQEALEPIPMTMMPPTPSTARERLAPDEKLPPLKCAGSMNGELPTFSPGNEELWVLDLWADWCPVVPETAPNLVEVQKKYADRGVKWATLTFGTQLSGEHMVNRFHMSWAIGYGTTIETIGALGAYNSGGTTRGYEVKPTLYLVRGDGTVLWCDDHARMAHWPPEKTAAALEAAIEKHLAPDELP